MSMKINWINKRGSRIADNNDRIFVSVYKQHPNGKAERVQFRFSEAVHANFSKVQIEFLLVRAAIESTSSP